MSFRNPASILFARASLTNMGGNPFSLFDVIHCLPSPSCLHITEARLLSSQNFI
jgi:hypothetical protein